LLQIDQYLIFVQLIESMAGNADLESQVMIPNEGQLFNLVGKLEAWQRSGNSMRYCLQVFVDLKIFQFLRRLSSAVLMS
jgi:hypothetical protein